MNEFSNNVIITQCRTDDLVPCGAIKYSPLAVLKIQAIWVCAKTVDFHCGWTLSLYNSTRSTSVQEDHFHSVYFAAGTASASLPWQRVCRRCSQRTVLVDLP